MCKVASGNFILINAGVESTSGKAKAGDRL